MKKLIYLLLLLTVPAFGASKTVYYTPTGPSGWLDASRPDTYLNLASWSPALSVAGLDHLVVSFTVTGSDINTGSTIDSVLLYLTPSAMTTNGNLQVYELEYNTDDVDEPTWNEYDSVTNVAWGDVDLDNDAHTHADDVTAVNDTEAAGTVGIPEGFDVEAAFSATWSGSTQKFSFLVRPLTTFDGTFQCGSSSLNRPRLVITYTAPTPTPTATRTATRTPTPTPTGSPIAPTPTMHLDVADEFGHNDNNRPAVIHGPLLMEEGAGFLADDLTGTAIANYVEVYTRDNHATANYKNLFAGDFKTTITGWVADADAAADWDTASALDAANNGSLYFQTVSGSPAEASAPVTITCSNTGKYTYALSYSVTQTLTFGMKVYFDDTSASVEVDAVTDEDKIWQRAALVFDCTAGENVTAVEVYLNDDPLWIKFDNIGVFEGGYDQGYVPRFEDMLTSAGGDVGGFTAGSVPFADTDGTLTEDNDDFFFNNSSDFLGIGVGTPLTPLHTLAAQSDMAYFQGSDADASQIAIGNTEDIAYVGTDATLLYLGLGSSGLAAANATIDTAGMLGLGTGADPDTWLEIQIGANSANGINMEDNTTTAASARLFFQVGTQADNWSLYNVAGEMLWSTNALAGSSSGTVQELAIQKGGKIEFENDTDVLITGDTTTNSLTLTEELIADTDANTVTVLNTATVGGLATKANVKAFTTTPNANVDISGNMSFQRWSTTGGAVTVVSGIDEDDLPTNDGFRMVIVNVDSADTIRLEYAGSSDAENQFVFSTGANIDLAPNETIEIIYDATTQCWRDITN